MFERWASFPPGNLLLLGPRRCGKTTLLRQRFPGHRYVTLDDFDAVTWARRDPKGFVGSLRPAAVIDEIPRLPELLVAVKYWSDRGELEWSKPLRLYLVYRGMDYRDVEGIRALPVYALWRAQ